MRFSQVQPSVAYRPCYRGFSPDTAPSLAVSRYFYDNSVDPFMFDPSRVAIRPPIPQTIPEVTESSMKPMLDQQTTKPPQKVP